MLSMNWTISGGEVRIVMISMTATDRRTEMHTRFQVWDQVTELHPTDLTDRYVRKPYVTRK